MGEDEPAQRQLLFDIGLSGGDGFAIARWLREKSGKVCIIMVTAAIEPARRRPAADQACAKDVGTAVTV